MATDLMRGEGRSIARRLDFDGAQSNYFGVTPARGAPLTAGAFVGDVAGGGSCNAQVLQLAPHCHGTHTEGVGHVTAARHDVLDVIPSRRLSALLITLPERRAADTTDALPPVTTPQDRVLVASDLAAAWPAETTPDALIIRTLPNPTDKAHARYTDSDDYAYLTMSAMAHIVSRGVLHLLIDTPSLDRLDDGGHLAVHRLYWGLPPGSTDRSEATRGDATVTEMIYVPDDIEDGHYALALQPAPFTGDATPSNPILYPLEAS
ncbi:MAG: cyclase family protein [Pseudomonadota bacterium]